MPISRIFKDSRSRRSFRGVDKEVTACLTCLEHSAARERDLDREMT